MREPIAVTGGAVTALHALRSLAVAASLAFAAGGARGEAPAATLCAGHKTCRVVQTTPAGLDAQGRRLAVIELDIGRETGGGLACLPYRREFWLTTTGARPLRLFDLCKDNFGSGRVIEDRVTVGPNRLTHFQDGGTSWRWSIHYVMSLAPFRVLSQEHCSYRFRSAAFKLTRWDWRTFKAEVAWNPPSCTEDDHAGDAGCAARRATRAHTAIPRLDAAAAALTKPLHLGTCAARLDMRDPQGRVRSRRKMPEVRMLMTSARDLIVTVADDPRASGAAGARDDGRIELWLDANPSAPACRAAAKEPMLQWYISLRDGAIRTAFGEPKAPPTLARHSARTIGGRREVTVHLVLPGEGRVTPGIAVAYSRADAAGRLMFATSTVVPGDPTTLGTVWPVDSRGAACAEKDGRLDLTDTGLPAALDQ